MIIRKEQGDDIAAIHTITKAAFEGKPYAGGYEQNIIDLLRNNKALELSVVAQRADEIVGQATFSRAQNADGTAPWFALGPVAVLPQYQSQGIGAAMIEDGLSTLQGQGALGCILTGNPNYYQRFGFCPAAKLAPKGEPQDYFQLKLLSDTEPTGRFSFAEEFYLAS